MDFTIPGDTLYRGEFSHRNNFCLIGPKGFPCELKAVNQGTIGMKIKNKNAEGEI